MTPRQASHADESRTVETRRAHDAAAEIYAEHLATILDDMPHEQAVLMFLAPEERPAAYAELARVLRPGGYLATAWKLGDDSPRRAGRSLGTGLDFDICRQPSRGDGRRHSVTAPVTQQGRASQCPG